nr:hypothetical protein [Sporomusa ovata]
MTLLLLLGGAGLVSSIIKFATMDSEGRELQQKFISLGNMKGKTLEEIVTVVGQPNVVSHGIPGATLYTWSAHKYSISIVFINGVCEKIASEIAQR